MEKITLKAARINACLTQKEAATKLNVRAETLGRWENYISTPKADKIDSICQLYNVPYDRIIFFNPQNA